MAAGDDIADAIARSGASIYDSLKGLPGLIYANDVLEAQLTAKLVGQRWDAPPRTRSKMAKSAVAEALGYPVPKTFVKVRPRFPGQDLDVYVQMEDNLQIWNEDSPTPTRRYALLRVDAKNEVTAVRVLTGAQIGLLDKTGTLTSKFQAKRIAGHTGTLLVSAVDTPAFVTALTPVAAPPSGALLGQAAGDRPSRGAVYTISSMHGLLASLIGTEFADPGASQDRLRGIAVQRFVSAALGVGRYSDTGQFPDIQSQVLEVKLQLASTIDLGLVAPNSTDPATAVAAGLRHCDIRYAIFYAERNSLDATKLRIAQLVVTTGADFFTEFQLFGGKVINSKLQIHLPADLFD